MPHGQRRRGSCEGADDRHSSPSQDPKSGTDTSNQPAKPTEAAAAEKQVLHGLVTRKLHCPKQLCANEPANYAEHRRVYRVSRQAAPRQLATKQPDSNEGGHGDENAEAGDFEAADAEQDWIHDYERVNLAMNTTSNTISNTPMTVPMTIPPVIQPGHIAQFMIHLSPCHS